MTDALEDPDFTLLLEREVRPAAMLPEMDADGPPPAALATMAELLALHPGMAGESPRRVIETLVASIDQALARQLNVILHAPDFQAMEASWRALFLLVRAGNKDVGAKV